MRARVALVSGLLALVACNQLPPVVSPPPIVSHHTYALEAGVLARVALVPFVPTLQLSQRNEPGGVPAAEAAARVARLVSETLAERGYEVVPASDLALVWQRESTADVAALAQLAAREFGATGILTGRVARYREREGEALGTLASASVSFELELYSAPAARRVWSARFDETQQPLSQNVFHTRRYPGAGTRWLSAAELARWGAGAAADSLPAELR